MSSEPVPAHVAEQSGSSAPPVAGAGTEPGPSGDHAADSRAGTGLPAIDTTQEPKRKKRKSRFADVPQDPPKNPLAAAQQALVSAGMSVPTADTAAPLARGAQPGADTNSNDMTSGSPLKTPRKLYEAAPLVMPDVVPLEEGIITKVVRVPNEAVGLVIGRGGDTIRQLQIKAGADIQVSREGLSASSDHRSITITGPPEEVSVAEMLIDKIVKEKHMLMSAGGQLGSTGAESAGSPAGSSTVYVPAAHIGLVIGRGGEQIRRLQDTSGANIQVAREVTGQEPPGMRQIDLSGGSAQIEAAKQMINSLVSAAEQGHQTTGGLVNGQPQEVITIEQKFVGGIIGRQGSTIQRIQGESVHPSPMPASS